MGIQESLVEASVTEITESQKADFSRLLKKADIFLKRYDKVIEWYQKINDQFIDDSTTPAQKATVLYKSMKNDQILTQKLINLQFNLESALNKFLDRKIYLTWVTEDGDFLLKDEDTLLESSFVKKITSNEGRGNISKSTMEELMENAKKTPIEGLSEDIQKQIKERQDKWRETYKTAVERFEEVTKVLKEGNKGVTSSHFYYDENIDKYNEQKNRSKKIAISGARGRMAEAYIQVLMAPRADDDDTNDKNKTLSDKLRSLNYYIGKDNIPAIVKGDVILNNNSSIHFAVKEGSFSTARFGQYYRFAYNLSILKAKGNQYFLTKEELTSYLKPMATRQNAGEELVKAINKLGRDKMSEVLESIEKSHSKKKS